MQPTVASVGPYSLTIRVAGACAFQAASCSLSSASPPMTSVPVTDASWCAATLAATS
jgi:hypothetical protein